MHSMDMPLVTLISVRYLHFSIPGAIIHLVWPRSTIRRRWKMFFCRVALGTISIGFPICLLFFKTNTVLTLLYNLIDFLFCSNQVWCCAGYGDRSCLHCLPLDPSRTALSWSSIDFPGSVGLGYHVSLCAPICHPNWRIQVSQGC